MYQQNTYYRKQYIDPTSLKYHASTERLLAYYFTLRQLAEGLWSSRLYTFALVGCAALFLFTSTQLIGCLLFVGFVIFMLLFCRDMLSLTLPFLLFCVLSTIFYEDYGQLVRFWWVGIFAAAAFILHLIFYPLQFKRGRLWQSLTAVSIATVFGGFGSITVKEYLAPVSLFYITGLGAVMLAAYFIINTQLGQRRSYDLPQRLAETLYGAGILTGLVIISFYIDNIELFIKNFAVIRCEYRNFCATMLLISLPCCAMMIKRSAYNWFGLIFLYFSILMAGSRSGLIFGTMMLAACLVYIYLTNPKKRRVFRACAFASGIPVLALGYTLVAVLFSSRLVDGSLIPLSDSRVTFFIQGMKDFISNPFFGKGLGYMGNSVIFIGVSGSIVWYHNLIAQVLGSMGLVGAAAYGWLFYDRLQLLIQKFSYKTLALGLVYGGMLMMSMTNPGEFCPFPNAFLMVLLFAVIENEPDKIKHKLRANH